MKELIHNGHTEQGAITELEQRRAGRSMNWLFHYLMNNRRETKKTWRAAAAAASAVSAAVKNAGGSHERPVDDALPLPSQADVAPASW